MQNKLKKFVRKHRYLHLIINLFRFKLNYSYLFFKYKQIRNIPFKYHLPDGSSIRLYPKGQIAKDIYFGVYEQEEVSLFFALLKPGLHIVDVGANIGLYSIIACKKLDGCGEIWAFEPSSQNYERFLLNLSLNKCDDLVTPVNMGLGNKDDEKIFLRRDRGCGDAEKYILPDNKSPIGGSPIIREKLEEEVIILTTLDSFMNKINNPKVDLIKMDIEGFEYFAFQGGRKILELNPDIVLLFECNELGTQRAGYTPQNIFDILNEYGLNCFYWNSEQQMFKKDKVSLLKAGNLWACNTVEQLPKFVS